MEATAKHRRQRATHKKRALPRLTHIADENGEVRLVEADRYMLASCAGGSRAVSLHVGVLALAQLGHAMTNRGGIGVAQ
jgi:hypothetical protein